MPDEIKLKKLRKSEIHNQIKSKKSVRIRQIKRLHRILYKYMSDKNEFEAVEGLWSKNDKLKSKKRKVCDTCMWIHV